jgi:sulfite oxidase
LDGDEKTKYSTSIPIIKAINPDLDCLIAYEMNGEELPLDHGYPLRLI